MDNVAGYTTSFLAAFHMLRLWLVSTYVSLVRPTGVVLVGFRYKSGQLEALRAAVNENFSGFIRI